MRGGSAARRQAKQERRKAERDLGWGPWDFMHERTHDNVWLKSTGGVWTGLSIKKSVRWTICDGTRIEAARVLTRQVLYRLKHPWRRTLEHWSYRQDHRCGRTLRLHS